MGAAVTKEYVYRSEILAEARRGKDPEYREGGGGAHSCGAGSSRAGAGEGSTQGAKDKGKAWLSGCSSCQE